MKKIILTALILFLAAIGANGQSWLEGLGQRAADRAEQRAKQKVEDKVDQAVDEAVDAVFDAAEDAVTGEGDEEAPAEQSGGNNKQTRQSDGDTAARQSPESQPAAQAPKTLESAYTKSDFVPGDEIIFADDLASEQPGEFPSRWDLLTGTAEIASIQGSNSIYADPDVRIAPLMKNMESYLPEIFTIEFDIYIGVYEEQWGTYHIFMYKETLEDNGSNDGCEIEIGLFAMRGMKWTYHPPGSEEVRQGGVDLDTGILKPNEWHHVAISFNKRALKLYLNGQRMINIPSMEAPKRVLLEYRGSTRDQPLAIKDFRMAQGAVPLYDRMMTDGKIVTYGITFDVGKSTVKPESMTEINRIAQLMKDNPSLKFSVEGHTDSTGNPASNQTLSDARSKAVMEKLIGLGIAADRLKASGKGQNNPIADNSTDEGRAKNRRVEFVKL